MLTPQFHALANEMALANQMIGTGLTAIRKANLANKGVYAEAFFNLSIGLERMGKLIFILHHCYTHGGTFPTDKDLKNLGHDIKSLFAHAQTVRELYPSNNELSPWTDCKIADAIIMHLSHFAARTRYYNLDYLTVGKATKSSDPLASWQRLVITPILKKHYSEKARKKDEQQSHLMNALFGDAIMVRFTSETGKPIDNYKDLSNQTNANIHGNKWAQLYLLRIVRFLALTLDSLSDKAYELRYEFVPHVSDFFGKFHNDDSYFKTRKTWNTQY